MSIQDDIDNVSLQILKDAPDEGVPLTTLAR